MKKSLYLLIVSLIFVSSCGKEFLEKKSNKSLTNPSTIADYWALLDNREIMKLTPGMGQIASDDQYYITSFWSTLDLVERNSYTWAADTYEGGNSPEWQLLYQQAYYANCVLEGLEQLKKETFNKNEWNKVKGSALFFRAYAFYNLAETYAKPYSPGAATDPGIPLRLGTDLSIPSIRASVQATYEQIINDLTEAKNLVPTNLTDNKTRPSKPGVTALLSRVFLSMGNFQMAENYADTTLNNYNLLLDYNTVDQTSTSPFNRKDNAEVLYESNIFNWSSLSGRANTLIDPALINSYGKDDLRLPIFFRANPAGQLYFKGRYTTLAFPFSGLAVDEVLLNRAECLARRGQTNLALQDLNRLLSNRWRKLNGVSLFTPYQGLEANEALNLILMERRKELVFRGIRWTDLRRLNREASHQVTLMRTINGTQYTLLPNSNRYAFPIPQIEITLSGIQQNQR